MQEESYWMVLSRRPVGRRRLLAAVAAGGAVTLGCSTKTKTAGPSVGASSTSGTQADQAPQPGGTFNAFLNTNFPLDPHKISASAHILTGGVYSRVFRFKSGTDPKVFTNHDIESDLGISAESPDAITWTVKLRTDAKFTNSPPVNGHAVEAEDVKATFIRALDPSIGSPNRGALNMIEPAQIQTPAKDTLVFKLNYPYAPFRSLLASPGFSLIVPRESLSGGYDLSKIAIGSGPFLLDSATPDVAYVYKKNPNYYEKGAPYVDTLRIAVLPTIAQQLAQYAGGNLDELIVQSAADLATVKQNNPKATFVKGDYGLSSPIYFQLGDPTSVFQDIRVRRAVSMALDRDAFSKVFFNDDSVQPVFVPAFMGKWSLKVSELDPSIQQYYKNNPAEAKKLLESAGQSNLQVKLAYTTGSTTPDALSQKQAETLANMLGTVGIKCTLVAIDFNKDFIDAGRGIRQGFFDKDMILFVGQSNYTEADDWLFQYFHSKSTTPAENLKDPALDAMIDKERIQVKDEDRVKAVQDVLRYVAEKMYLVSTVGSYKYAFVQPKVQNYCYTDGSGKLPETYAKVWLKQ